MLCPQEAPHDEHSMTRQQISARIDVCMGGRAAESVIFGKDQVCLFTLSLLAIPHYTYKCAI